MLAYPYRDYKLKDIVIALCESRQSNRCKRVVTMLYRSYKYNLKRNDGVFKCVCCIYKERHGVDSMVDLRWAKEISGITKNVGINSIKANDKTGGNNE